MPGLLNGSSLAMSMPTNLQTISRWAVSCGTALASRQGFLHLAQNTK
jgi:hypothetical protein